MTNPALSVAGALMAMSLVLAACDSGSGPHRIPHALEAVAGAGQSGTVGKPVPEAPSVRVSTRKGKPVRGQVVVFSVVSGGGAVSQAVVNTDEEGEARVGAWVLGPRAGQQIVQALVEGLPPLFFMAQGVADDPASIVIWTGDGQTGFVGAPLHVIPSVRVRDAYENLVEGAPVEFLVTKGGGVLAKSVWETNSAGIAEAGHWTLGTVPGPNSLRATIDTLPPVTFSATGLPDVPSRATVLLGDGQTAQVGTDLPLRPTLLLTDRFGNLLEGIPVTFEVTQGGGSIANSRQVSGKTGVVVSGPWTLGPEAGLQTLQAKVPGLVPVLLSATAEPGPPAALVGLVEGSQAATVAKEVPDPPRVRVEDQYGNPVPGVAVSFFPSGSPDPDLSPGTVDPQEATTDETGVAVAERWTLGTVAGPYSATATADGVGGGVEFYAEARPDEPDVLLYRAGDGQVAKFGAPVAIPPSVRVEDRYGNGVGGVTVDFVVEEGGGVVDGTPAVTDPEGVTSVGQWTLGPAPGPNRLSASAEGLGVVVFQATALTAVPSGLNKVAGDGQMALVGSAVLTPPRVQVVDAGGAPISGVPISFSIETGSGSVEPTGAATDEDGIAAVDTWVLGTVAGENRLRASVEGLDPVFFSGTGLPGPPASLEKYQGDNQKVLAGNPVRIPPGVRLLDSFGNPTPGLRVEFSVSAGGGMVLGGTPATAGDGVASVQSWILGPAPGTNELNATYPGLLEVVFEAEGLEQGEFEIELDFQTPVDPSVAAAFDKAVERWEVIIVGDVYDVSDTLPVGGCQPVLEEGGLDDLKVYVTVMDIDGSGGVLGRAGPCYFRTGGAPIPVTGVMELDEADLEDLEAADLLQDVIVHELAHVLGFGILWDVAPNDLLVGAGSSDPYFQGATAIAAFDEAGGSARPGPKVPVENTGGPGTRDGHWRESVHDSELMTGWIEVDGIPNPLSAITIGSFADMGYSVNMNAADPYVLFDPLGAPARESRRSRIYLQELPPPIPIPLGSGRIP